MAGDDKIKFELDLDSSQFLGALKDMGSELSKLTGRDADMAKLVGQFKNLALAGGAVAAAYYGVRTAINTIIEAEEIHAINRQFEMLAENVGIASDKLKKGLTDASGGLLDDTQLLEIANRSLISMGKGAERLPEIMTLARKATAAFGGDLTQRFQEISHAIATGQTRMLKQIGITVDADAAYKAYAKTLGATAKQELSEAGKQQALLNTILERGAKQYKDIDENAAATKNTLTQLKVTIQQIGEVIVLAFEKTAGPTIRRMLGGLREMASDFKEQIMARFGDGAEGAAAKVNVLNNELIQLKARLIDSEQAVMQGGLKRFFGELSPEAIQSINAQIAAKEAELKAVQDSIKSAAATAPAPGAPGVVDEIPLLQEKANQKKAIEKDVHDAHVESLQKMLANANTFHDQIATSAKLSAAQSANEWRKAGGLGGASMKAFQNVTMAAFANIGAGSQSVAEALKSAFLGALGQVASQQGQVMFLSSFETWPVWPTPKTAGGLGLIALGGLLGAAASGAPSVSGAGGGGGAGGLAGVGTSPNLAESPGAALAQEEQKKKSVTIQIQGNYFETEQTKTRLMEMVREATDATDFKYVQIGGT